MGTDSGTQNAGEMRTAFAPVQTGATDGSSALCSRREDAEVLHLDLTTLGEDRSIVRNFDRATGAKRIGDADTQRAR